MPLRIFREKIRKGTLHSFQKTNWSFLIQWSYLFDLYLDFSTRMRGWLIDVH